MSSVMLSFPPFRKVKGRLALGIDDVVLERPEVSDGVAFGRLDLDHAHAEVGEDPPGELALLVGQVERGESLEQRHGDAYA